MPVVFCFTGVVGGGRDLFFACVSNNPFALLMRRSSTSGRFAQSSNRDSVIQGQESHAKMYNKTIHRGQSIPRCVDLKGQVFWPGGLFLPYM